MQNTAVRVEAGYDLDLPGLGGSWISSRVARLLAAEKAAAAAEAERQKAEADRQAMRASLVWLQTNFRIAAGFAAIFCALAIAALLTGRA